MGAVGQTLPMLDAQERVCGRINYVLNVELPGMLFGQILRSPFPHARLVRVDDLFRFTGAGPHELVRVRGAVTMVVAGSGFFLRTEGGGLWVQTAQPLAAQPSLEASPALATPGPRPRPLSLRRAFLPSRPRM